VNKLYFHFFLFGSEALHYVVSHLFLVYSLICDLPDPQTSNMRQIR